MVDGRCDGRNQNSIRFREGRRRILAKECFIVAGKTSHVAETQFVGNAFHSETRRIGHEQALPDMMERKAAGPLTRSHPISFKEMPLNRTLRGSHRSSQRLAIKRLAKVGA